MPFGYMNSDELIRSVKIRAAVPISQITYSEEDILRFAQEEIEMKMLPNILAVKEEFYVIEEDVPLVSNKADYDIPYRAIGGKIRSVFYKQTSGYLLQLANIPIENLNLYQTNNFPFQFAGIVLQNDQIKLVPSIGVNPVGSLIMRYYLRPNNLVLMSRGARVKTIDRTTGIVTVAIGNTTTSAVPANITSGSQIDFIKAKPSHKTYDFDITPIAVNTGSGTITFNPSDIPEQLAVGDWICSAGETVIPQIPSELHSMLAQAVACRVLESLTDTQALQNATAKLQEMEQKLLSVIDTRVESPGRKVVNTNSMLNKGRLFRRRYF